MAIDHLAGALGNDRNPKAELLNGASHLFDDVVVLAWVTSVGDEFAHRPVVQFDVLHRGLSKVC